MCPRTEVSETFFQNALESGQNGRPIHIKGETKTPQFSINSLFPVYKGTTDLWIEPPDLFDRRCIYFFVFRDLLNICLLDYTENSQTTDI